MLKMVPIIRLLLVLPLFGTTQALTPPARQKLKLQSLIQQSKERTILLPGVHDALTARIFQQAGAECLFLSGFGVSATYLGAPDAGILTLNEMETVTRRVTAGCEIPCIVDGDTGYGGVANMRRAIRGLAQAGATAVSIEDQVFPKKCTYSAGEKGAQVVSQEESVLRIQAARAAQKEVFEKDGIEVLLIARSDCRVALGLDEAIQRCLAYEQLGADIVYAENLQSSNEYETLRLQMSPDTPMILAQVQLNEPETQQQLYSLSDVQELGYNFALMGVSALQAQVQALELVARTMMDHQGLVPTSESNMLSSFSNLKATVGFSDLEDFEQQFTRS